MEDEASAVADVRDIWEPVVDPLRRAAEVVGGGGGSGQPASGVRGAEFGEDSRDDDGDDLLDRVGR